jgi:hypothetical protein
VDSLFDFTELRVQQPGGVLANRASYKIFTAKAQLVAIATETEAHTRRELISKSMPDIRVVEVTTAGGEPVLSLVKHASEWRTDLQDPAGELIGRLRTGDTKRTYTLLDGQDRIVGKVTGDLALKHFCVNDLAGGEFAQVRKTWAGLTREMFRSADRYKVKFTGPVSHPARTLTVMLPILLDLTSYGPV